MMIKLKKYNKELNFDIIITKTHYLRVDRVSRNAPCCAEYITHIHTKRK